MTLNDEAYDHSGYVTKIVIYWKEAHSVSECVGTMTNGTIKNLDNKTWEYTPSNVTTVHPENFSIYFSDATKDKDFTLQKVEITKLLPDYWILSSTKTEFTHTYDGTGGTENYGKYIVAKDYKTGLPGQNYNITSTYFSNQGSNGPITTLVNANTKVVNASQGASSSYVWKNVGNATITVSPVNDQYYTVFIIGQPKIMSR